MRTRKFPNTDTFHAVLHILLCLTMFLQYFQVGIILAGNSRFGYKILKAEFITA